MVQEERRAVSASRSYLTIGVLGGLVTLMGVFCSPSGGDIAAGYAA
ncbi:MAG: hypothetical protein ACLT0Y_05740 [Christensenellales bacterium]